MDDFIFYFFYTLLILVFIVFFVGGIYLYMPLHNYECIDYKGDTIYCKSVRENRGYIVGETEDGTTVVLKSYKRIESEGENENANNTEL